jgi:hypothetical protein
MATDRPWSGLNLPTFEGNFHISGICIANTAHRGKLLIGMPRLCRLLSQFQPVKVNTAATSLAKTKETFKGQLEGMVSAAHLATYRSLYAEDEEKLAYFGERAMCGQQFSV